MENLFEQLTNISKASAYDIVVKQVEELKEENKQLNILVDDLRVKLQCCASRCIELEIERDRFKMLSNNIKS